MIAIRTLLLWLVLAVPASAQTRVRLQPGDLVLRGGQLFDAVSDDVRANRGIVIRAGVLLEVDADLAGRDLSAARVLDLGPAATILPGFFDLHAHYAMDLFGEGRIDEYEVNPIIFLANGVTSTFPAGEVDPEGMRRAREEIDAGRRPGPRLYNSGPYFGTARPGWDSRAMTPDSIRAEVDYWASRGVRGFKAKGIAPDQLAALIERAHRHGLTVTGHLDSGFRDSVNPRDAILMGIDRIEHFSGGDAIRADQPAYSSLERLDPSLREVREQFARFIAHGVYYDATLTAYGYFGERDAPVYERWGDDLSFLTPHARAVVESRLPRPVNEQFERIYRAKLKEIRAFHEAGGTSWITLGTDHPSWGEFLSGFGVHREMHALVRAGIPTADVLRIATIHGARALGVSDRLGTIEAGKYADLVVVMGHPLEDIRHARNVRWVVRAGDLHDAAALLSSVRGRLGPRGPEEDDAWKGRTRFAGAGSSPRAETGK
ncbi:MAG: amidohydrolase family protein [Gemmatimonadetes bacterium]|nr:amidohydrolase family protein [Gemmatimonadota bacterium]